MTYADAMASLEVRTEGLMSGLRGLKAAVDDLVRNLNEDLYGPIWIDYTVDEELDIPGASA